MCVVRSLLFNCLLQLSLNTGNLEHLLCVVLHSIHLPRVGSVNLVERLLFQVVKVVILKSTFHCSILLISINSVVGEEGEEGVSGSNALVKRLICR